MKTQRLANGVRAKDISGVQVLLVNFVQRNYDGTEVWEVEHPTAGRIGELVCRTIRGTSQEAVHLHS